MNSSQPAEPSVALNHGQILVIIGSLMLGTILFMLDQLVVATALPTIVGELGGIGKLSWVITAYLLVSTAAIPIYGKLSDLYGRKPLFQFGLVVFILGSILAGMSQNMTQLIIFRGIQGLGGGGIISMAQAIIGDIIAPRERGKYQAYMSLAMALAQVSGPLVGGLFTDHLSWRWIFYVNLPFGAAAFVATHYVLHLPVHRKERHSIDFLGSALMVGGVSALLLALTWGGSEHAWDSATILGLLAASAALIVAFILQEMRAPEPIVPLRLFKDSVFSISSAIAFLTGIAIFGAFSFLPLYMQVVKGASATESALRGMPMMVGMLATAILIGMLISKTGRYRPYPIIGTGVLTVALFLLSTMGVATQWTTFYAYQLLLGCGFGFVMQTSTLIVQNAVEYKDMGTATAGVNFFRSIGNAFGVAVLGAILNNRLAHHLPDVAAQAGGLSVRSLTSSPERIRALPPEILSGVLDAFTNSLQAVFFVTVPICLAAFVLSWFLKEIPLRDKAHLSFGGEGEDLVIAGRADDERGVA